MENLVGLIDPEVFRTSLIRLCGLQEQTALAEEMITATQGYFLSLRSTDILIQIDIRDTPTMKERDEELQLFLDRATALLEIFDKAHRRTLLEILRSGFEKNILRDLYRKHDDAVENQSFDWIYPVNNEHLIKIHDSPEKCPELREDHRIEFENELPTGGVPHKGVIDVSPPEMLSKFLLAALIETTRNLQANGPKKIKAKGKMKDIVLEQAKRVTSQTFDKYNQYTYNPSFGKIQAAEILDIDTDLDVQDQVDLELPRKNNLKDRKTVFIGAVCEYYGFPAADLSFLEHLKLYPSNEDAQTTADEALFKHARATSLWKQVESKII